ncbi:MAG: TSUP family transporter [Oscillospiraceae bacterium]|nr:TSUP family transporter [Oscillospiraceae bacterium]
MRGQKIKCAVTGAVAGAANGFFGAGGGMLLAPLLRIWVKLDERRTFATSVAVIMPLCVVSVIVDIMRTDFHMSSALPYLIGGLAGGFIGGRIFKNIPVKWLHRFMGAVIIYGGIRNIL